MVGLRVDPNGQKDILHIEYRTTNVPSSPHTAVQEVDKYVRQNFAYVDLGITLTELPNLAVFDIISIRFADIESTNEVSTDEAIKVSDVKFDIRLVTLHGIGDEHQANLPPQLKNLLNTESNDSPDFCHLLDLPNISLNGIWDSLIFEDGTHFRFLRYIIRMLSFIRRWNHPASWTRLLLFYGPPGTGKTTLCRALAQQLSIRLSSEFPSSKLIEVNANAIFSKFFSESGKAVIKVFTMIESWLKSDENCFICVFIDEVESLACKRQDCASLGEPQETVRAVNALLVALDRLRAYPNIIILCTSNMIQAMDTAFLSRVDIMQHIPEPGTRTRYEILRLRYLELAECGVIAPKKEILTEDENSMDSLTLVNSSGPETELPTAMEIINKHDLPDYKILPLCRDASWAKRLWDIAEKSTTLDARAINGLPMTSLTLYSSQDPVPMDEALEALSRAVDAKLSTKQSLESLQGDTHPMKGRQSVVFA